MNTYMSISITNYGMNSSDNYGIVFINVDNCQFSTCLRIDYTTACKELAKLAKRLNKAPTFIINQYNPNISYRELSGYLD